MLIDKREEENLTSTSLIKTIDARDFSIVSQALQSNNYRYPIKSAIRETASNGVDSHNEREMAKAILNGALVSDYYTIEKGVEDTLKHASIFDPTYYDLDWLSSEKYIKITIIHRDNESRDLIRFEDWGVGLGGKRMEGFFSLAYSSKRLSKKLIGGFGLGAKAFLATDIDNFRVISYYNGKKFIFDVNESTVNSIVPKFSDNGKMNDIYTFPKSKYECYYEETIRKNGVIIEASVVKSQTHEYIRAVKTQLLYMNGVKFFEKYPWTEHEVNFKADILYSDDDIMISDNNIYSKPHVLMGDKALGSLVSYGNIDFDALELPQYYGSVGIIVSPDEVDVSTSRENLLWKRKTKLGIQKKFEKVVDTAREYIKNELKSSEDNLFSWLSAANSIIVSSNKYSYSKKKEKDAILLNLSKVIDIKEIVFKKEGDEEGFFEYTPIQTYFKSRENILIQKYLTEGVIITSMRNSGEQTKRIGITTWNILFTSTIYFVEKDTEVYKEVIRYLKKDGSSICFIHEKGFEFNKKLKKFVYEGIKVGKIKNYNTIVIPEEEREKYKQLEESINLTAQQRRIKEKKFLIKQVANKNYYKDVEVNLDELKELNGVYAMIADRDDLLSMSMAFGVSMYIVSNEVLKLMEEVDSNLKYYKDALFEVQNGDIIFTYAWVNIFITKNLLEYHSLTYIQFIDDDEKKITYNNFPKIFNYLELFLYYRREKNIMIADIKNLGNSADIKNFGNSVNSKIFPNGIFSRSFSTFLNSIIETGGEIRDICELQDKGLIKRLKNCKRLSPKLFNKFATQKKINQIYVGLNKNRYIIESYNRGKVSLEVLNNTLELNELINK